MATPSSRIRDLLFRSNPIPMFLYDADSLRICGANDSALAKYGYTCNEFRSMTIHRLYPCGEALDSALRFYPETPALSLCCTHVTKGGRSISR